MQEPETSAVRVAKCTQLSSALDTPAPPRVMKHEEVCCIFFQKPGKNCPQKGIIIFSKRESNAPTDPRSGLPSKPVNLEP